MAQKIFKLYSFVFILFSDFALFAQEGPGNDFEDEEGSTGGHIEDTPINGKLVLLLIAGLAFAWYYYKVNKMNKEMIE